MIVLTENRKLELIEECKKVMRQSSPDGDIHPIYQIALASLKANFFAHGISASDGKVYLDETCCIDYDGKWVSDEVTALNDGVTDLEGGYRVVPLFTAPPVPEIKLPEYKVVNVLDGGRAVMSMGYNEAIDEIKRLNGLGE